MKFRCACCHVIYDESPGIPEYEGMEAKGVCEACVKEHGLEKPKGETDEN